MSLRSTMVKTVSSGDSPPWMRNGVQALVHSLPNARRRTLSGQTHGINADVIAPVLDEFFSG